MKNNNKSNKSNKFKIILFYAALIIGVFVVISLLFNDAEAEPVEYSDVVHYFESDAVLEFTVDKKDYLVMKVYDGELKYNEDGGITNSTKTVGYQLDSLDNFREECSQYYMKSPSETNLEKFNFEPIEVAPWWVTLLPYAFVIIIMIVLWFVFSSQVEKGGAGKINSFGKARVKMPADDKNKVLFKDVAGADEEKEELREVVDFLKDPEKFAKLGAKIPHGVLLVGPPGTGKTLLAKAVAGEAGVPFFSISGSDFVEMYVGVGASRVRDLFENARKAPASIIFIDEIDAVGRHRGAGLGGGHDEREQTLNQLLVEMDGFGTNSGVIIMAATNRPDILDPALLRPGRFDRRVTVNYPDLNGREAILKVHCRNKPLEETVDLRKIAMTTIGFTGAELANLMNESALLAAKRDKALIGMKDIEDSYMKLLLGPQKKTKVRPAADNKLCAYHEAGHAVASYYCKHTDPVKHITIVPAGGAGGVTISVPTEDRMTTSRNSMLDHIVLALGGRVAEALILDDISTGASNDIQQATNIARNMVTRYGMSDKLGTVLYGSEHSQDEVFLGRDFSSGQNYSEKTAAEIDEEIRSIIAKAYDRCKSILSENIDKLHFVANFLLKNEFMDDEQFAAAMEMENPTNEAIENIAIERKKKSEEENESALAKIRDDAKNKELERERELLAAEALRDNLRDGRPENDLENELSSNNSESENQKDE